MKRSAEESSEGSGSQGSGSDVKITGDLSDYHINWSICTYGTDYHMDGHDFKRSNMTGELMFNGEPPDVEGTQVGFIAVTQYRMRYIADNGINMREVFDEDDDAYNVYEAIASRWDDLCFEADEDTSASDLQLVERVTVDPAHRGHGLGLFMIEAANKVLNGHLSAQVIHPFPLQYEHGEPHDEAFAPSIAKLRNHYGRLGFELVQNTEFMLRWNGAHGQPSLDQAMPARPPPPPESAAEKAASREASLKILKDLGVRLPPGYQDTNNN